MQTRLREWGDGLARGMANWGLSAGMMAAIAGVAVAASPSARISSGKSAAAKPDGREIFNRQWKAGEKSPHGGDGLGPMYNDVSCVACHFQGGVGGSGPNWKNVEMLAIAEQPRMRGCAVGPQRQSPAEIAEQERLRPQQVSAEATRLHPGFSLGPGVVLHVFSTQEAYNDWRRKVFFPNPGDGLPTGQDALFMPQEPVLPNKKSRTSGGFTFDLSRSQRNTPALFGAGLINGIPDSVLHEQAARKFSRFREITGRVARHADGKLGRFGWKGQTTSLRDFVHNACAVEMGLSVPGKPQVQPPHDATYQPPGLDLDGDDCRALVSFVAKLPAPVAAQPDRRTHTMHVAEGEYYFGKAGCATCHVPTLGNVQELFSDLLLHDMGAETADAAGGYGGFRNSPTPPEEDGIVVVAKSKRARQQAIEPPSASEWRTPPLWGVADSAPYLHDGRAATLEDAIQAHRGEATRSAQMFQALPKESQLKLVSFLKSLKAPQPQTGR